jgi:D-amino peptidase
MKIYISADIEGVTGVTHWDETDTSKKDSDWAREQMTAEVAAACEGALQAGATEIWVKDAHWTARNLIPGKLPLETKLIRGWSGHPLMMVQELDASFQALLFVGYHSRAASGGSPLAHSMSGALVRLTVNGHDASEFLLNSYSAAARGVPVAFLSGDQYLCDEVKAVNPHITTVAVKQGIGDSTLNIHPALAVNRIRDSARQALSGDLSLCQVALPKHFDVELTFPHATKAVRPSYYPGARLKDPLTVAYCSDSYDEVLRFLLLAF